MSLEDKIDKLTAAIEANTAALGKGGAVKASDKAIDAAAAKAGAGKKVLKIDDLRKAFGEYLGTEDDDLKAARTKRMAAINKHFGVKKISELDEERWPEAMAKLKAAIAAEKVADEPADEDEDEALV